MMCTTKICDKVNSRNVKHVKLGGIVFSLTSQLISSIAFVDLTVLYELLPFPLLSTGGGSLFTLL